MIIRETSVAASVGWFLCGWSFTFCAALAYWADNITSRQWLYLMGVPGHQWTWVTIYGVAAWVLLVGMVFRRYRIRAAGLLIMGTGCTLIFFFYLFAPLIDPGLVTLGSFPWAIAAGLMYVGAAINWSPSLWF